MIYVFDTSSLSKLKHFFPGVFKSVWLGLDTLVKSGELFLHAKSGMRSSVAM